MFDTNIIQAIARQAAAAKLPFSHLAAIVEVESAGRTGTPIKGEVWPMIRFEGHYFYKRVVPHKREQAIKAGLAAPKAGVVKNPREQMARYAMLEKAAALDRQAAFESTSWGVGQVMGAHWKDLKYPSVLALVEEARSGVEGQIALMLRFILKNNLGPLLQKGDWPGFARRYNGPAYDKNAYDTKMAVANERWQRFEKNNPQIFRDDEPVKPAPVQPAPKPEPVKPAMPPAPKPDWTDPVGIPDLDKPLTQMTTIWGAFSALVSAIVKTFADLPPWASYALLAVIIGGLGWMVRERLRRREQQRALEGKADA